MLNVYIDVDSVYNMPKKETADVVKKVAAVLTEEPKTVAEIAEAAGVSWEGAKKALELLVSLGVAVAEREGKRVKYRRSEKKETIGYFGMPVGKKEREKIRNAYGLIRKVWEETTGKKPTRVQVYKVLARVNKEFDMGIPMGRYLYGEIPPVPYMESDAYPVPSGREWIRIEERIRELAETYGNKPVWQMVRDYYTENGLAAHRIRGLIANMLARVKKNDIPVLGKYLTRMIIELDDRESREYLAEFMGCLNNLIFAEDIDDEMRTILTDAFDSIWKFAATKMYYEDIRKYYGDMQLGKITADLEQRRAEMVDALTLLREAVMGFVPKPPEDADLEELRGSAKG